MGLLSWLFGNGAKAVAPNLISPLVVTAAKSAVTPALSSTIGSALGSAAGSALSSGLSNTLSQPNFSGSQTPTPTPSDNTVSGVDVIGTPNASAAPAAAPLSSLGGALIPALAAGAGALAEPQTFQQPALANIGGGGSNNTISGLDVMGAPGESPTFDQALGPAIGAATGVQTNVPDLTQTEFDALHNGSLEGNPLKQDESLLEKGAGLLGLLGLRPRDLLGLGLLGAGLGAAGNAGGGTSGLQDQVQQQAGQSQALANTLNNKAMAGLSGDIGGKGMSYISRMVRNAQAAIRQKYAAMGMSGSTAEQSDLNEAVQKGVDEQFKIGQQQATAGLQAAAMLSGQSAQAYLALLNAATQKGTALGNSLANFTGAVAGRLFAGS